MWARDLGIGAASAVNRLPPHLQQQLSVPRVLPPRPARAASSSRSPAGRRSARRRSAGAYRRANGKWVFISHASEDKKLAAHLVELLRAALNIPAEKILCTSVEGYKLPAGVDTDAALRRALLDCKTLVGIISPASRVSTYVLLELGARWGTDRELIPLTACGVAPGELKGPLARKNALDCSSAPGVLQFVGDMGTKLGMDPERPEVFQKHVDRVVRTSKAGRISRRR
ncbi:MAG: toll/interleukin-1 receptor domain-containing protein [Candidatus Rokuibacteriota bacterium]